MINHQERPWEASRVGGVEGGVLKVGSAVKSPAHYVPFADPGSVELIGSTIHKRARTTGGRTFRALLRPNKHKLGTADDLRRPREVWLSAESAETLFASHRANRIAK